MLKNGSKGKKVVQLQESLVKIGYELPKYGADGDYGKETETAVSQFKQELIELTEKEDVSSDLQTLIDALVAGEWNRPSLLMGRGLYSKVLEASFSETIL